MHHVVAKKRSECKRKGEQNLLGDGGLVRVVPEDLALDLGGGANIVSAQAIGATKRMSRMVRMARRTAGWATDATT